MSIKKKAKPKKKRPQHERRKPQEVVIVSDQPIKVTPVVTSKLSGVRAAIESAKQTSFYLFGIALGISPFTAHVVTQVYCGRGEDVRCEVLDFPAWMEFGGMIIALVFANAMRDVVSKSAKQLAFAIKDVLPGINKARTNEYPEQDK